MLGSSEEIPVTTPSATERVASPAAAPVPAAATEAVAPAAETTETVGQHVEVDQGDTDNDSALGDGDA